MNKFTLTTLVLLCFACNKTSISDNTLSGILSESTVIEHLPNLTFTEKHLYTDNLCSVTSLELELDFDYYKCIQQSSSNHKINAFVFSDHLYLMAREIYIIDVMHIEYTDIDDFWVSTQCPQMKLASLGDLQLVRLAISSLISCVDTVDLLLQIGNSCDVNSFVESR